MLVKGFLLGSRGRSDGESSHDLPAESPTHSLVPSSTLISKTPAFLLFLCLQPHFQKELPPPQK